MYFRIQNLRDKWDIWDILISYRFYSKFFNSFSFTFFLIYIFVQINRDNISFCILFFTHLLLHSNYIPYHFFIPTKLNYLYLIIITFSYLIFYLIFFLILIIFLSFFSFFYHFLLILLIFYLFFSVPAVRALQIIKNTQKLSLLFIYYLYLSEII